MATRKRNGKNLVIVESPAKARTVGRFLGSEYVVEASMGHVRDLPPREIGVDVNERFKPKYELVKDRQKVLTTIRKAAQGADSVYLATDPDREGEAIAWHLVEAAGLGRNGAPPRRVVFHEITASAVDEAFSHPREIDMQLVNAQQARRILDRIVGYELSPVLWKKVLRGLSAGRVQSVALRLVVEREREIEAFTPEEYWNLAALLQKQGQDDGSVIKAALQAIEGQTGKPRIGNGAEAEKIVEDLRRSAYRVASVTRREVRTRPQPPFITSTLQQEAARRLRFGAQRTMRVAQSLYEGIQLGDGDDVGLITYMRTDSTNLAAGALAEAQDYIRQHYGADYTTGPRTYRTKSKSAQEAHEAIRPTSVVRTPESMARHLNRDQQRLYDLIWKRMVASQMADSVADSTTVDIDASGSPSGARYTVRASGSIIKFQGFRAVYIEGRDDTADDEDASGELPQMAEGEPLNFQDVTSDQKFTQPPPRYSEAMLIRTLEEKGIGRPSTYAGIVDTIERREYVTREQRRFKPTPVGIAVNDFLVRNFPGVMEPGFTAGMETSLDAIASGQLDWVPMLEEFYGPFHGQVEDAGKADRVPIETGEACELCERPMVIRSGRFGKFLSCSGYPECKNSRPLRTTIGVECPQCGGELVERRGGQRNRTFYGCSNYPKCDFSTPRRPLKEPCPECGKMLIARGRAGAECTACEYKGAIPSSEGEEEPQAAAV